MKKKHEILREAIGGPIDMELVSWPYQPEYILELNGKKYLYVPVYGKWFYKREIKNG